jgi:hypothetical protein
MNLYTLYRTKTVFFLLTVTFNSQEKDFCSMELVMSRTDSMSLIFVDMLKWNVKTV